MVDETVINIVTTQCQPEDEEKFNKWYDEVHIPLLLKSKELQGVKRYKVVLDNSKLPGYIAIYKFANLKAFQTFDVSPERGAAVEEMKQTWGRKIEITSKVQYKLLKKWKKI